MTEPIDPDVDLHEPRQRTELSTSHGMVLLAIAIGGGFGALARYLAGLLFPEPTFPVTTLLVNAIGCALLGVLMALLTERFTHPLLRPFFGTGLLGGFTTFSTSVVGARGLLSGGHPALALGTLFGTLLVALLAVWFGVWIGHKIAGQPSTVDAR